MDMAQLKSYIEMLWWFKRRLSGKVKFLIVPPHVARKFQESWSALDDHTGIIDPEDGSVTALRMGDADDFAVRVLKHPPIIVRSAAEVPQTADVRFVSHMDSPWQIQVWTFFDTDSALTQMVAYRIK